MTAGRKRVVVVGTGVAGSILADGLRNLDGAEVICLERAMTEDHAEAGTGLNIGPNAIKALKLYHPDIAETLLSESLPWESWLIELTDGRQLMHLPLYEVADNPGIRIRWATLYQLLRQRVRDCVRFGVEVRTARYARTGEAGPIVVETVDRQGRGEKIEGIDLLVGGDGRYSKVRQAFWGAPQPTMIGVCIFRLLLGETRPDLVDDYGQWFNGPNRLLAFRVPGGSTYISGSFPIPLDSDVSDDIKNADSLRQLYTPPAGLSAKCKFLVEAICSNVANIHWARLQEAPAEFCDSNGRILLLGDAAHPMVPTLGQGGTQAIEDACIALDELRRVFAAPGDADIATGLRRIEARRLPRVQFVTGFSRDATDTMLAGADPVAGTLAKTSPEFRAKLARLYRDVSAA